MSYRIKTIPHFERQAKRLARKFKSFKKELSELFDSLMVDPTQGTPIGNNCYKIRMSIKSKGKGNQVAQGLSLILLQFVNMFFCSLSLINPKRIISPIKNCRNF